MLVVRVEAQPVGAVNDIGLDFVLVAVGSAEGASGSVLDKRCKRIGSREGRAADRIPTQ